MRLNQGDSSFNDVNNSGKLGASAIAGIAVGGICLIGLSIGSVFYYLRTKKLGENKVIELNNYGTNEQIGANNDQDINFNIMENTHDTTQNIPPEDNMKY